MITMIMIIALVALVIMEMVKHSSSSVSSHVTHVDNVDSCLMDNSPQELTTFVTYQTATTCPPHPKLTRTRRRRTVNRVLEYESWKQNLEAYEALRSKLVI